MLEIEFSDVSIGALNGFDFGSLNGWITVDHDGFIEEISLETSKFNWQTRTHDLQKQDLPSKHWLFKPLQAHLQACLAGLIDEKLASAEVPLGYSDRAEHGTYWGRP